MGCSCCALWRASLAAAGAALVSDCISVSFLLDWRDLLPVTNHKKSLCQSLGCDETRGLSCSTRTEAGWVSGCGEHFYLDSMCSRHPDRQLAADRRAARLQSAAGPRGSCCGRPGHWGCPALRSSTGAPRWRWTTHGRRRCCRRTRPASSAPAACTATPLRPRAPRTARLQPRLRHELPERVILSFLSVEAPVRTTG